MEAEALAGALRVVLLALVVSGAGFIAASWIAGWLPARGLLYGAVAAAVVGAAVRSYMAVSAGLGGGAPSLPGYSDVLLAALAFEAIVILFIVAAQRSVEQVKRLAGG